MGIRVVEFAHTKDNSEFGGVFGGVARGNARATHRTLEVICTKSIWLVQLEISGCGGIEGDVAPLGLLLALRVLRARECRGLTGTCWRGGVRRLPGGRGGVWQDVDRGVGHKRGTSLSYCQRWYMKLFN